MTAAEARQRYYAVREQRRAAPPLPATKSWEKILGHTRPRSKK
jgi:hypothetical protein